jgi:hypothetical protein
MTIKNKIITKKQWYLKNIKEYLERYIQFEESDEYYPLERYLGYNGHREFIIDYIKSDLEEELFDDLTCINGVGGEKEKEVGMIEFINMFSDLDLKIKDFRIEKVNKIEKDYIWKKNFNHQGHKYEYLSDFFGDFVSLNAENILNEVENVK